MTNRNVAEAGVRIVPDLSGFGEELRQSLNRQMDSSLAGVGQAAKRTAQVTATALAGIGTAAVKSFTGFEESLSRIVGLVGVSQDQVDAWRTDLEAISRATAVGPDALAEALFDITSAGLEGATAIEALEAAARASAAGLGETRVVADAVTSAINAYGAENLDAATATDVLVASVREGKLQADTLAGSIGKVIPVASQLGVSFDQVGATIAALSKTGLTADEAATSLRQTLVTLLKPTSEAGDALAAIGLSAADLREKVADDGLLTVLGELAESFDGNEEATAAVFGNVRALTGVLALTGESAGEVRDVFDAVANSSGALGKAFGAVADDEGFALRQAFNEIKLALVEIGEDVAPAVADAAKDLAPRLVELAPKLAALIVSFVDLASVVAGPLTTSIGVATEALNGFLIPFSQAARNREVIKDIREEFEAFVANGEDPARGIAIAIATLAAEGRLSADNLQDLQRALGASNADFEQGKLRALQYAQSAGFAADQVATLRGETNLIVDEFARADAQLAVTAANYRTQQEAAAAAAAATSDLADETTGLARPMNRAVSLTDDYRRETTQLGRELEIAAEQQKNLTGVLRSAADPVFAAVDALDDYNQVLEDVNADGKVTADEQIRVARGALEVSAAFETLNAGGVGAGVEAIAAALGLTREEIEEILEQLEILDGSEVNASLIIDVEVPDRINVGGTVVDVGVRTSKGGLVAFHRGGHTGTGPGGFAGFVSPGEVVLSDPDQSVAVYQPFAAALADELAGRGGTGSPMLVTVLLDSDVLGRALVDPFVDEVRLRVGDGR